MIECDTRTVFVVSVRWFGLKEFLDGGKSRSTLPGYTDQPVRTADVTGQTNMQRRRPVTMRSTVFLATLATAYAQCADWICSQGENYTSLCPPGKPEMASGPRDLGMLLCSRA